MAAKKKKEEKKMKINTLALILHFSAVQGTKGTKYCFCRKLAGDEKKNPFQNLELVSRVPTSVFFMDEK